MARPNELGLSYFNLDTDIFQDRKVRRLIRTFKSQGFLVYIYVLNEIYRDKGCYILWDEDIAFDISDTVNIDETLVEDIVKFCCKIGLFNYELLQKEGILTSESIQIRWEKISKEARRKINSVSQINPKFSLMQEEIELIPTLTPLMQEETPLKATLSTQRKGKESKGKKSKENVLKKEEEKKKSKEVEFLETETLNPPEDLIEEVKPLENNSNKFDSFISRFEKEFVNLPRYAEIGEAMDLPKIQLNNYFSEFITENKLSRKHQIFMFYNGFSAEIETHFVNWLRLKVNKNKGQIPETENNKRVERMLKSLRNARQ